LQAGAEVDEFDGDVDFVGFGDDAGITHDALPGFA
jgi:hypothetical protein